MIVDPWGVIVSFSYYDKYDKIGQIGEEIGYTLAEIDLNYVKQVRKGLPCQDHIRRDLY